MIPELGLFALIISLGFALLLSTTPWFFDSKRVSVSFALGQMAFVIFSCIALGWAFYTDDFSVVYVAHNSNINLPTPYKLSAIWGGHEGSMLLWYAILCFWTCLFCLSKQANMHHFEKIKSATAMILGVLGVGFNLFLLMTSNPFARYLPEVPLEGADLNPLLQDFGLIIHPPILYLGYVGFAIPFALSLGCLLTGSLPNEIAKLMRPWVLSAWSFLTIGIALGSWWAYYELGWGGWWFWDPVENASFMPWLAGIALLHMIKVTEKRNILSKWTVLLAITCFSLSLLGTFLVRSGVLTSVHAFAVDPLRGEFILKLLALLVGGALGMYALKANTLKSQKFALFSREGFIFLGSIILFVLTASILLGTLYPIIIDATLHTKLSVGPPYFNAIFMPFTAFLLFNMGIAPHIKWNEDKARPYFYLACIGIFVSFILSIGIWNIFQIPFSFQFIVGLFLSIWLILSTAILALKRFKNKNLINQSFISMAIAHLGVAVCVAGVVLTTHLDIEKDVRMGVGDSVSVGEYQFYLKEFIEIMGPNYEGIKGKVEVFAKANPTQLLMHLYPEKRLYMPREMPISETAIDPGFFRDLYVALGEPLANNTWSVRIYIKPFVRWIWFGALLMAVGGFFAVFKWKK